MHDIGDIHIHEMQHPHTQDSLISTAKRNVWFSDNAAVRTCSIYVTFCEIFSWFCSFADHLHILSRASSSSYATCWCCATVCDLTHSYRGSDVFLCGTWLVWGVTYFYVSGDVFICVEWRIYTRDVPQTHSYRERDVFVYRTWLVCI